VCYWIIVITIKLSLRLYVIICRIHSTVIWMEMSKSTKIALWGLVITATLCSNLLRKLTGLRNSILNIEIFAAKSCHVQREIAKTTIWLEAKVDGKRVEDWATTYPSPISVCQRTAFHDTLFHPLHHTLPHQLTDYQRSDKIWSAAATTTSLSSWWSVIQMSQKTALKVMFSTVSVCLSVKMLTKNYWAKLYDIFWNGWT